MIMIIMNNFLPNDFNSLNPLHLGITLAWQAGLDLLSGNGVGIIRIFSLGIRVVFSGIGMSLILAFSYKSLFYQKDLHSRHNDVS